MNELKKVVTDNPKDNIEALLNYAHDKGGRVVLSYANGEKEKDLSKYISELANSIGCEFTPGEVMDGECLQECPSCHVQALNLCAIQAAELRERLKRYESLIDSGKLVVMPCIVDSKIYAIWADDEGDNPEEFTAISVKKTHGDNYEFLIEAVNKNGRIYDFTDEDFKKKVICETLEEAKAQMEAHANKSEGS